MARTARQHALVLDVGTTGVKALVFDGVMAVVAKSYLPLGKRSPKRGWVEQDPAELAAKSVRVLRAALKDSGLSARAFVGLGITNQRETTILWDKKTGRPVAPAIVWEDSRTARFCARLRPKYGEMARRKTGLAIDPYFSATKVRWLLDNVPAAARLARGGRLAFGTVDAFLLQRLCTGAPHRTDVTNSSRTLLYDIARRRWDDDLLRVFGVPEDVLPEALPSRAAFGELLPGILGAKVPVVAVCGDQQSSGYAASREAARLRLAGPVTKVTFGTGIFLSQEVRSANVRVPGFFTTLMPGRRGATVAAVEQKIGDCAKEVSARLGDDRALRAYFDGVAVRIAALIRKLPARPRAIIVDGGASRDGIAAAALEAATGIPMRPQRVYDGTALGTALLVAGK
ncbi:MAG TPA: FGGY family carbohydrate kinase [Candidatus Binatia bacterium]|nr:FGGY family carbohydrate kinase [Candidatus Binatia bacterium]